MMVKIGIIGQGFVGTAVREGLKSFYEICTYDKYKSAEFAVDSLFDLIERTEIVFVCLPTPMRKSGECDTRLIEATIQEIDEVCKKNELFNRIVVVKSTIPPGTTQKMNDNVEFVQVVFNPEFLTEANANNDYKNQNRIILGGPRPATSKIKVIFSKAFPGAVIVKTGSNTAEMVKYFTNCFLSTKVSFANEMRQICERLGIDYDKVVEYTLHDHRIGKTHLSSPGPDGSYGFGGHCFPKDLNGLMHLASELGVKTQVMAAVWDKNLEVRTAEERDWERMEGRAVSED